MRISETYAAKRAEVATQGERLATRVRQSRATRARVRNGRRDPPGQRARTTRRDVRRHGGRLRLGPEVPDAHRHRATAQALVTYPCRPVSEARPPSAEHRHDHPDQDGPGRYLRSLGRRILPLLHRSALDDPPLREDALRQRLAPRPLCRRPRARFGSPVRRCGARNGRLGHARDAAPRRRLLRRPGRRQRGRGRQVLRVAAGRREAVADRGRIPRRRDALRSRQGGELRGQVEPLPAGFLAVRRRSALSRGRSGRRATGKREG